MLITIAARGSSHRSKEGGNGTPSWFAAWSGNPKVGTEILEWRMACVSRFNCSRAGGVAKHRKQEGTWGLFEPKVESKRDPCLFLATKNFEVHHRFARHNALYVSLCKSAVGRSIERNLVLKYY
jgi:hypothetical protein